MREFSELTSSISLSPNHSGKRTKSISRITPHCIVGQATEKRCQELFVSPSRQASANYCISCDGKIVGIVPETYRSWCSGGDLTAGGWTGSQNDQAAITIECASDSTNPYAFTGECYTTLINLCVDICKAYGKKKILWIENKEKANTYVPKDDEMIFTVHRWYARKSCPGDWLYNRMGDLAASVNKLLGADPQPTPTTEELYRVRKSWEDVSSQIGAYKIYDNAVKVCNENPGYSVFDSKGKCLYTSKTSELYRVRLSWGDTKSQLGAYSVYKNAVKECDKHSGYSVYDSNGACLYTSKKSIDTVAKEVIQGKWGNGEERKQRLTKAGYDYHEVQALVNKMLR